MNLTYVSNLSLKESSGGWSGINLNLHNQLSADFDICYCGPLNPPFFFSEKLYAKIQRQLGFKSDFAFFSERRLRQINNLFETSSAEGIDAYFFLGNTPWIKTKINKPYYVYMDADFITYLKVFSDYSAFKQESINRIVQQEKKWLEKAETIFFGSNWVMNETIQNLNLPANKKKYVVVNTGGHIPIPEKDTYTYRYNNMRLLFIALNFEKKGGFLAVEVLKIIRKSFPSAILSIIGEKPPTSILETDGVTYIGLLDKNKPVELNEMTHSFENATFLIHPTKMDTMGAIIPEANYFGCPVVASKKFGIPDLIKNGETGLLINDNDSAKKVAAKIVSLFGNKSLYLDMRRAARKFSLAQLTWEVIGKKISHIILHK